MRHSRSRAFERALADPMPVVRGWSELAHDPNDPLVLAHRARTLRAAWRDEIPDRAEFIVDRARGARVLDIGCVAHDIERMRDARWLHARVAAVGRSCLGVDVLDEGVAHMRALGYDAIAHDLSTGPGPVLERGPFDVIVAGELIEHVAALDMLFTTARDLLAADGQLIVTTPNPWAPHRVEAGQRGDCWENVDHIVFAFPSGMAELAERHGLVLSEAATTVPKPSARLPWAAPTGERGPRVRARSVRRWVRGSSWVRAGITTTGAERTVPIQASATSSVRLPRRPGGRTRRFLGETFVYVVRRPAATSSASPSTP